MGLDAQLQQATQQAIDAAPRAWDWMPKSADKVLAMRLVQRLLPLTQTADLGDEDLYPCVLAYWNATKHLAQYPNWTAEDAWAEFCVLWDRQDLSKAKGDSLQRAMNIAAIQKTAPELLQYEDASSRFLGQTCRVLADQRSDNGRFFISCRSAGRVMGKPASTGKAKLRLLCRGGTLAPCDPPRANIQRYKPKGARRHTQWYVYIPLTNVSKRANRDK